LDKAKSKSTKDKKPQRTESMFARLAQFKSSVMTNLSPQAPLSTPKRVSKIENVEVTPYKANLTYDTDYAASEETASRKLEPGYEYVAPAPSRSMPMTPATRTKTTAYQSPSGATNATVTITTPAVAPEAPHSPSRRAQKMVSKMFTTAVSSAKAKASQAYEAYQARKIQSMPQFLSQNADPLNPEETKLEKELMARQTRQLADQLLLQKALRDIGRGKVEKPNTRTETLTRKGDYKFDGLTVVEIGKKTLKETKIKVGESILEVNGTFAMNTTHVTKLLKEASYPTKVKVAQVGQNFSDI